MLVAMIPSAGAAEENYSIEHVSVSPARQDSAKIRLIASGDCTLIVAQYEETGRMLGAKTVSVKGGEGYQTIPVTLSDREAENYDLKAFLLNSVTRAPLCDTYVLKNAGMVGELYSIVTLDVEAGKCLRNHLQYRHEYAGGSKE